MTAQEFYDFCKYHNKLDAEIFISMWPDESNGVKLNQYMIDIICKRDAETKEKKFVIKIG